MLNYLTLRSTFEKQSIYGNRYKFDLFAVLSTQ